MAVNNLNSGVGIQPTIIDAKGDLLVGTGNDAINRLGVTGPTGSVLVTDAGETTGLKWVDPGTVGGLVHIETQAVSGASAHSFGSDANPIFSSLYDNYQIVVSCTSGSGGALTFRLRANTTDLISSVYDWQETLGNGTSGAFQRQTSQGTARVNGGGANDNASTVINLFNPFLARDKSFHSIMNYAASPLSGVYGGNVRSAVSYNGFTLLSGSGTNFSVSVSIYGWKK
jgi:hypothetical protein